MLRKTLEALAISLSLITNSCNVITQINEDSKLQELREQGYDPYHAYACGPDSLHQLLLQFNESVEPKEISKTILENHPISNIARSTLGILRNDAMRITWPWEIKDALKKYLENDKYKITVKTGQHIKLKSDLLQHIAENKKGIALIRDYSSLFNYHWISFQSKPSSLEYYGKNTVITALYNIEER